ncbi:hypothetical protein, partial [Candidatus Frankia alpina]|uniref:hypothetical protein n=1 Tax=Candidatus Frankia alpina TaxID=2699483 RepID=UPI001A993CF2
LTVTGGDRPPSAPGIPAQPSGADSSAAAAEGGPFGDITTLTTRLLNAPVAFVARETAPSSR